MWVGAAVICAVGAIAASIFSKGDDKEKAGQNATTSGPQSPGIIQSGTGSTANVNYGQISHGANSPNFQQSGTGNTANFHYGASLEDVRKAIAEKDRTSNEYLLGRYTNGYVLFGMAPNGEIQFLPRFPNYTYTAKWEATTMSESNGWVTVFLPGITYQDSAGQSGQGNWAQGTFQLREGQAFKFTGYKTPNLPWTYFEVLDIAKKQFVVGFSGKEKIP